MKTKGRASNFLAELVQAIKSLKKIGPNEVHVLTVNASYGRYQLIIGPKNKHINGQHFRPIEISGEIHHLFATPKGFVPQPTKKQVLGNLRNTVIMRDLVIHLKDPTGDGRHIMLIRENDSGVHPREVINMAGKEGEKIADQAEHERKYSLAAYRIIQNDILRAVKKENRKAA